jgi:hypothetical protein
VLGPDSDPTGVTNDFATDTFPGHGPPRLHPTAIRAVLTANANADVLRRRDDELDTAFEQPRKRDDLTPLKETSGAGG